MLLLLSDKSISVFIVSVDANLAIFPTRTFFTWMKTVILIFISPLWLCPYFHVLQTLLSGLARGAQQKQQGVFLGRAQTHCPFPRPLATRWFQVFLKKKKLVLSCSPKKKRGRFQVKTLDVTAGLRLSYMHARMNLGLCQASGLGLIFSGRWFIYTGRFCSSTVFDLSGEAGPVASPPQTKEEFIYLSWIYAIVGCRVSASVLNHALGFAWTHAQTLEISSG